MDFYMSIFRNNNVKGLKKIKSKFDQFFLKNE